MKRGQFLKHDKNANKARKSGRVKFQELTPMAEKPPSDYGLDPLGRARVFNKGKVKVEYGQ
ncbi:MAG: hypothetical protein ACFUZC_05255 [Chthoniobacteraceae bacterium]